MSDGKFFSGWVLDLTYPELLIRAATDVALTPGELYAFTLTGVHGECIFSAKFSGIDDLDVIKNSSLSFLEGSNVQMMSVHENTFEFKVVSELQFKDPSEKARKSVQTLEARFELDGQEHAVQVLDISDGGCSILSPVKMSSGDKLNCSVLVQMRVLTLDCEVRSCRRSPASPDFYRIGLKLGSMTRIDHVSWLSLLEAE